jgi:RNA polymerase sigma-70 factor (ECF subfamily)
MFEVIVRRYNQPLFRTGIGYLAQREPVEDAMQNTYLKAFLHLKSFDGRSSFSTWLTRIMINECLMMLRRDRLTREIKQQIASDAVARQAAIESRHAGTHAYHSEMKTVLEQTIRDLPENYRVAYLLCEVQHLDLGEAAACLDISVGNLKVRVHRAKEALKMRLLACAAGVELFPFGSADCDALTARVLAAVQDAP